MKNYVKDLVNVGNKDLLEVGGKAGNLGEMLSRELPVPEGFVVLTKGYRTFVQENHLEGKILELTGRIRELGGTNYEKRIEELFMNSEIPKTMENEILQKYEEYGSPTVAVRSSATAEDLPGLSFAGQYSSYLNVHGNDELLNSIKACWASLWNERAVSYRERQGIGIDGLAHGVVVQQLVKGEKAGILFTANPLNGRRDQMLINASWGLGEAIVGGEVNPDQWIVDRNTGDVVEELLSTKEVMTVREQYGIKNIPVPEEKKMISTLEKNEIIELIKLAEKVENHYGTPQDLEWAMEEGKISLVQTRPVTSLFPVPEAVPGKEGLRIYMNFNNYSQAMKEPFTPMGAEVMRLMAKDLIRKMGRKDPDDPKNLWYLQFTAGRMMLDVTDVLRNPKTWKKFDHNPADKDPITLAAMKQLLEREREEITSKKGISLLRKINWRMIKYGISGVRRMKVGQKDAVMGRKKAIEHGENLRKRLYEQSKRLQSRRDRMEFIENAGGELFLDGFGMIFYVAASSKYLEKAEKILMDAGLETKDLEKVEKAVPYSVTTEMGMAILKISKDLDERGERATEETPEVKAFLKRYGHRNNIELDVGVVEWAEDPSYVLDLINTYIETKTYDESIERFEKSKMEAEEAILRLAAQVENAAGKGKGKKLEKLLRDYREMFGIRELSKFYVRHTLSLVRKQLQIIGEEMVEAGQLDHCEDVFYLSFENLVSTENLREKSRKLREKHKKNMELRAPRIMTSTGEAIHSVKTEEKEGHLTGIPVSPGNYEGRVRILHHPEEGDRLEVGDILVTTGTNPAWTPLFLKLGALVMETGGTISHGSVVAREYGLPAVAGVADATTVLKDLQRIRIDGETGSIEVLEG